MIIMSMGSLDKNLPSPLYHQLECVLRRAIESGEYEAGQQLPNEGQLAQCFAVSKITVRQALHGLANHGYVMDEIAEMVELPDAIGHRFANRGYYGSVNHDVKAQYQLYLGWFDGNPAHLHPLPPADAAVRWV